MLSLFLSFRLHAYWARCLPRPLASPVPVLVVDIELLKINHFRRRMHLTGILSVVTNLPMLISCLPFPRMSTKLTTFGSGFWRSEVNKDLGTGCAVKTSRLDRSRSDAEISTRAFAKQEGPKAGRRRSSFQALVSHRERRNRTAPGSSPIVPHTTSSLFPPMDSRSKGVADL